jgi:pilus assembly protein CpaF
MEGSVVTTQDIFVFRQAGVDDEGRVRGSFQATGTRPKFVGRLKNQGIPVNPDSFRFRQDV